MQLCVQRDRKEHRSLVSAQSKSQKFYNFFSNILFIILYHLRYRISLQLAVIRDDTIVYIYIYI